ncbi:MAG TPA: hypothetical protein VKB76_13290, partial [Ktedonobacterales bacterium]|nr:hypothetical protein [Ktedonobacterales bacterium]
MRDSKRRSLLIQLLSVYLLFVMIVLAADAGFNVVVEHQLRAEVQTSDQALGQEIALETDRQLSDDASSLAELGTLAAQAVTPAAITDIFRTYQVARSDVNYVYWLDPVGTLRVSWPLTNSVALGAEFSPPDVVQRAITSADPVFEVGIAVETTFNAGAIIAAPVRDNTDAHNLIGIVAANVSLEELSEPLASVITAQHQQDRRLLISIVDQSGELIATTQHG